MGRVLLATGRPIVYSTNWLGYDSVNLHLKKIFRLFQGNLSAVASVVNLERMFDDIRRNWSSIVGIIDYMVYVQDYDKLKSIVGPGFWPDTDMVKFY